MNVVYDASHIKRRRASKLEMSLRAGELLAITEDIQPCTVRQVYYQATVRGVIDKTEAAYNKVQRHLVQLRRDGRLPYGWIADNTRWQRKPQTYGSIGQALAHTARTYRRALWTSAPVYVEVWCEKDALAGVIRDVTEVYDVPLMVARGYASETYLFSAAECIRDANKPAHIYHLGDYDPSGQDAARHIESTLRKMAPDAEIYFERIAVTPEQIEEWNLPSRPTKKSDTRTKTWTHGNSVELDAIPPRQLRDLVERHIIQHVDKRELSVLRVAEDSERQHLRDFANTMLAEE